MADEIAVFNGGESPLAKTAVSNLVQGQTTTMPMDGGAAPSLEKEKEGLLADTAGAGGDPPLGGVVTAS
jgi:hypothetical protein